MLECVILFNSIEQRFTPQRVPPMSGDCLLNLNSVIEVWNGDGSNPVEFERSWRDGGAYSS